jgi:1-acyl-sn-glycerol-3-phosphate acyltransferase
MYLRTLIVWVIGLVITFFLFPFALVGAFLDRSGNAVHSIGALWSRALLFLSGVRVKVTGAENIPSTPVVLASNHRGAFDIPVLQAYLPLQFRWVAKRGLFKIPLVGWAMTLAGYVSVDRKSAASAYKSIERAVEKIKKGASLLIFPEGTRNPLPGVAPFKRGGFILAIKSGAPIVPVAIKGTEDVMKKGGFLIRPSSVKVSIARPIDTKNMDEKELMDEVKSSIEKLYSEC